jgi:hypothetical protein
MGRRDILTSTAESILKNTCFKERHASRRKRQGCKGSILNRIEFCAYTRGGSLDSSALPLRAKLGLGRIQYKEAVCPFYQQRPDQIILGVIFVIDAVVEDSTK